MSTTIQPLTATDIARLRALGIAQVREFRLYRKTSVRNSAWLLAGQIADAEGSNAADVFIEMYQAASASQGWHSK